MALITDRLTIRPLDAVELDLYADDPEGLARRLGLKRGEALPDFFRAIVRKQRVKVAAEPENRFWHTFWLIIDDAGAAWVGSIDFKNVPGADRCVEIGYGIDAGARRKGYATEAVKALCAYAFQTGRVDRVIAETEHGNAASEQVLAKAGFARYERKGDSTWWERPRKAIVPRT